MWWKIFHIGTKKYVIYYTIACSMYDISTKKYIHLFTTLTYPMIFQTRGVLCIYYNLNKQILYIECKYKIVTILHRINFYWLFAYSVCVINKIRLILIETLVSLTHILELKCIFQIRCWQKFSISVSHWEDLTRGVNAYGQFLPVYQIFDGIIIQMQMTRWNLIVDDGLDSCDASAHMIKLFWSASK